MTQPTPIPEAMIKAAALALHKLDNDLLDDPPWEHLTEDERDSYRRAAEATLAAALATCEVHEQYGWVRGEPETEDYRAAWHGDRAKAESEAHYWKGRLQRDFRLARRLKIVTPAEDFPGGESA